MTQNPLISKGVFLYVISIFVANNNREMSKKANKKYDPDIISQITNK